MTIVIDPATINVTIDFDHMGRVYAVVPDEVAHRLNVAVKANWKDYRWMGESEEFPADHWVSQVCRTILAAVAERVVEPGDITSAKYGNFYGFVAGERAWDSQAKWWADYRNNRDYIVRGCINSLPDRSGKVQFTN